MCICILWSRLYFFIKSKSLWYEGVTHYKWHSGVQMGSGKGDSCHHCCTQCIYRWPKVLNHHLQAPGVRCDVGGDLVNWRSYADEMVLLAPKVTALQTLFYVCRAYAGPHDIVCNTTKTVCMLVRAKQSEGRYSTTVMLGNEELSCVNEFRYLGHLMTADCP